MRGKCKMLSSSDFSCGSGKGKSIREDPKCEKHHEGRSRGKGLLIKRITSLKSKKQKSVCTIFRNSLVVQQIWNIVLLGAIKKVYWVGLVMCSFFLSPQWLAVRSQSHCDSWVLEEPPPYPNHNGVSVSGKF